MFSLERYSCTSFDLCAGALSSRSSIPRIPEVGLFVVLFVQFRKSQFLYYSPVMLFPALHGYCSTAPFEWKKISGIAWPFRARSNLPVPMLCSLHFPRGQTNTARFYHRLPVHRDALGRNFLSFWWARSNRLPYPSCARASKYGESIIWGKLCSCRARDAVCWMRSDKMFKALAISLNGM